MAHSPPTSPSALSQRPVSALLRAPGSSNRISIFNKQGGGSRAADDDGKTSVKVAIRVRPPLKSTDPGFELIPQRFQRSMAHVTSPTSLAIDSKEGRKLFVFDRVFGEDVQQEGIWDYLEESVAAFLQGYNVSVLAYGQSGSGKSYTMGTSGPTEQSDPRLMGVIPRAATMLFRDLAGPPPLTRKESSGLRTPTRYSTNAVQTLQSLSKNGGDKNWHMKATYVEIYNEQLRDLLVPENVPQGERSTVNIREDPQGRILLTGLHQVEIRSVEDLLNALNFGSSIRQTDATAINAKSSRSHAIFSINLVQRKMKGPQTPAQDKRHSVPIEALTGSDNWITLDSKLHFVDLAGSERLKNTQASGERAREGISINGGLASLGKVIQQLSSRQASSHISYRDSKLTRLLQDSLGGNAWTYLIACVNPAEFHLSETLNTVHYAQRARAIQSKPQIQQISDETDKQATIDRLRAEVSFLREQVRNPGRGDRSSMGTERQNEREIELQNHLLDLQENYGALSQRHSKLISEITKARDTESSDTPTLNNAVGDSAVERLKRSNSFAEAVEQVVLEYEKTIQSLETSLSNTRSSLATTESSLVERETKYAYVETVNQQLQARLQKMMDRESSTEHYLHDLETKLDGHTSGEEKNSAIVIELRKEIARVRENEASCEDYISTLEERLAEADQDMELMQREVDRLEHVVERQRSLGKLDNLLYELDHVQQNGKPREIEHLSNGISGATRTGGLKEGSNGLLLRQAAETAIPESDDEDGEQPPWYSPEPVPASQVDGVEESIPSRNSRTPTVRAATAEYPPQSPAQSRFMADKLEDVTQELFDLRVEHESTLNEYDMMSAKYEEAIRTLAEFQDAIDEARRPTAMRNLDSPVPSRPTSFLGDARVNELKNGGHLSSSRSLSSELFSAGDPPNSFEASDTEPTPKTPESRDLAPDLRREEILAQEIEQLKKVTTEKDEDLHALSSTYTELHEIHLETLDVVEELKAEVYKAKKSGQTSPTSPVIRRKSAQNVMTIDRAHRSFASLRNIAAENFEKDPDTMQNFELNLNAAMHELHQRSERVQVLEADLASVKKEMETKMAIIAGLTRERSSLSGSSLLQSENQMRLLHEDYTARERELLNEITVLKKSLSTHANRQPDFQIGSNASAMPGIFPETPALETSGSKELGAADQPPHQPQQQKVLELQKELSQWQKRHHSAAESLQVSEKKLLATTAELETSTKNIENMRREICLHVEAVDSLQKEIGDQKKIIESHVDTITGLDQSLAAAHEQIAENTRFRDATQSQLDLHRDQISLLEKSVEEHQSAVEFHKNGFKALQDSHAQALDNIRTATLAQAEEQSSQHVQHLQALESEINENKAKVDELNNALVMREKELQELNKSKEVLARERESQTAQTDKAAQDLASAEKAKQAAIAEEKKLQTAVEELTAINRDTVAELEKVNAKERKAARLVDELEEQIATTYEQHKATSSRLSIIHTERNHALEEANAAKFKLEEELEAYRLRLEQNEAPFPGVVANTDGPYGRERSTTLTNNLRKSSSVIPLPSSPPPAIPLPPLPNHANGAINAHSRPVNNGIYDAGSRHASRELIGAQQAEEQDVHIKNLEKQLFAEKQLTASLEEALVDLETQGNKIKIDMDAWKKKAWTYADELDELRKERNSTRYSVQAVEEERLARKEAEAARAHLEESMHALNKKKKKSGFNCF
ncbi:kinesin family protein [Lasallia pustulata]|uniref:Kinesin family protein n=1 Tax=Lasallia pustulata TaxID=136370 RepID=A0A1W5DB28_9LECA|nr:kinesin family protein [Lasallia pustulata]